MSASWGGGLPADAAIGSRFGGETVYELRGLGTAHRIAVITDLLEKEWAP